MSDRIKTEIRRVNGYLKEVVTLFDESGKILSQVMNPLMVELRPRDVMQILVGAFLVATPLCFTEEVWNLSEEVSFERCVAMSLISLVVVIFFVYFNFYRLNLRQHIFEYIKRVLAVYLLPLMTVALVLVLIDKLPWEANWLIAYKRVAIIGFPAIFGATLSDLIK